MTSIQDILIQVLGNISDAAAIIDRSCRIIYANDCFRRCFIAANGHKKPLLKLQGIDIKSLLGKSSPFPRKIPIPSSQHDFSALNVYLINTPDCEEARYVLISDKNGSGFAEEIPGTDASALQKVTAAQPPMETLLPEFSDLIGEDPSFKRALLIAQKAAKSDLPVLILGESGTGKEILARAIHRTSRRSAKPLVDVNCAAIPDTLIESELFGYERGAFTGARTEGRLGYFDAAHEGTILMDEIGDASLQSQSKLLRVLEDGCFKRVGGNRNVRVNVRLISSTNKDLKKQIAEKAFREDLFYRLNTFTIQLPPLRERVKDIALLVDHFLVSGFNAGASELQVSSLFPGHPPGLSLAGKRPGIERRRQLRRQHELRHHHFAQRPPEFSPLRGQLESRGGLHQGHGHRSEPDSQSF